MPDAVPAPATLAYAHVDQTDAADASARAFRFVGTLVLAAMIVLVAYEMLAVVILLCVNAAMIGFRTPATIAYLVYLPATAIVAIVTLRRMRAAPLPMSPTAERTILWGWRWLLLIGLLQAIVQAAVTLVRYLPGAGGRAASWWLGLAISDLDAFIGATMPMLMMLLIARHPLAAWPRRLSALLLAYFLPRAFRPDLIGEIASWLAAIRTSRNPSAELLQLGHRFAPWKEPWACVVFTLPLGLAILRKPHRSMARALALVCLAWVSFNWYAAFRGMPGWFNGLMLAPYQLRDAVLTMAPAWVLAWLSFQPQDVLGDVPSWDRATAVDATPVIAAD